MRVLASVEGANDNLLGLSADGRWLAYSALRPGEPDGGEVRLLEVRTGRSATISSPSCPAGNAFFDRASRWLAAASSPPREPACVVVWDLDRFAAVHTFAAGPDDHLAGFTRDGRELELWHQAMSEMGPSFDRAVFYDASSGAKLRSHPIGEPQPDLAGPPDAAAKRRVFRDDKGELIVDGGGRARCKLDSARGNDTPELTPDERFVVASENLDFSFYDATARRQARGDGRW